MFMAMWRKKEEDATGHRQEREANEIRKYVIVHGSVEPANDTKWSS